MKLSLFVTLLLLTVLFSLGANQDSGGNPHGKIKIECSICHSTDDWKVVSDSIKYDHDRTGFPLKGLHTSTKCRDCHQNLIFAHIGVACIDCHADVHKAELGFTCQNCHTPFSWNNAREIFESHSETRFPLVGVHAIVDCEACHYDLDPNEYKTTPLECVECHRNDYTSAQNPDHVLAQFETDCESCHSLASPSWYQSDYVHPESFVLRSSHLNSDCNGCHTSQFAGTPTQCEDCHMEAYLDSRDPDHNKFGFPTSCETCHNEIAWEDAQFDHTESSGFELKGAHATIQCIACHVNNQITGLPRDCIGCHDDDYRSVSDPDHVKGQFSDDCLQCHSELAWSPATFDHNATNFPLTGAHISIDCSSCHINGQFTGLATDCWSCHEADFIAVVDPNHEQGQFSHNCLDCHTDVAWKPATFDHNNTEFPLTGTHLIVSCSDCHQNGQYAGLATDCFSCHESEFNATTDPNHQSAGFPVQCEDCHNTVSWDQTTWDHDSQYFPIYTGAHHEAWESCVDCHMVASDFKQFECIFCHDHNKTDMDEKHKEEQDYVYQSDACYDCHPAGKSED